MKTFSDESCKEIQNIHHFMFNSNFSSKSCNFGGNVEKYDTARETTDDNIIWRMRFASWITKATNTHSEYVIHIALLQQQLLQASASMSALYVHCLSFTLELQCELLHRRDSKCPPPTYKSAEIRQNISLEILAS